MNQYHGLRHGKNYEKVHIQICKLIALLYCTIYCITRCLQYNEFTHPYIRRVFVFLIRNHQCTVMNHLQMVKKIYIPTTYITNKHHNSQRLSVTNKITYTVLP